MYVINRERNDAKALQAKSFQELGFREREHLQEWICKRSEILGEELLIIQKEFSGFDDTRERLDLLAVDKEGKLVIIENKLDDSGRDVMWQSLKYASYCATLTKEQIKQIFQQHLDKEGKQQEAGAVIAEFLNQESFEELELTNDDQRIIMVAANFRKEVTSTVMWLMERNIKIKCIRVAPYQWNDQILLDAEQIIPIPTKDAEDYMIKIANKKQEKIMAKERQVNNENLRMEFWSQLLQNMNQETNLFKNISPSKDSWIARGSGISYVTYNFHVTGKTIRVELSINSPDQEKNEMIYAQIEGYREQIEKSFAEPLYWDKMEGLKSCRIAAIINEYNFSNKEEWSPLIDCLIKKMIKLEKAMGPILKELKGNVRN